MRKTSTAILLAALLLLCGCAKGTANSTNNVNNAENSEQNETENAATEFQYADGNAKAVWERSDYAEERTDTEALPGVEIRYSSYTLTVRTDGAEEKKLYSALPVWDLYLCDLTGDGEPELCSTCSFGSGSVREFILAYDLKNDKLYEQKDSRNFNYQLIIQDEKLCVQNYPASFQTVSDTGTLVLKDEELKMRSIYEGLPCTWKTLPSFELDNVKYQTAGMPSDTLPDGYLYALLLNSTEALEHGAEPIMLFRSKTESDLYTYQNCGTVKTEDGEQPRWAYVRWIQQDSSAVPLRSLEKADVEALARKGARLNWADFEPFRRSEYKDGGYDIQGQAGIFHIYIGSKAWGEGTLQNVELWVWDRDNYVDLKTGRGLAWLKKYTEADPKKPAVVDIKYRTRKDLRNEDPFYTSFWEENGIEYLIGYYEDIGEPWVYLSDGTAIGVRTALERGLMTLRDLDRYGIKYTAPH